MSEVKTQPAVLAKPVGWCSSLVWARTIRIMQLLFTIVALALCARTSDFYEAPSQAAYATAVSVFSLVYLLAIFLGTLFGGPFFMVGPLLVSEIIMLIMWFAAFIAMAVFAGGAPCSFYFYTSRCREAKAAIAMCAFNMVLYAASLTLLVLNCVIPLISSHGAPYLWRYASDADATFDQGTGLLIYSSNTWVPDPETGVDRQVTASSVETPVGAEKPVEEPDQALFQGRLVAEPIIPNPIVTTTADPAIDVPLNAHVR